MSIKQAAQNFVDSFDFPDAIVKSTMAGWSGDGYSVELFPDGHYRVLWDNQIGNLYESPGVIVRIPQMSPEDYENGDLLNAAIFFAVEVREDFLDSI